MCVELGELSRDMQGVDVGVVVLGGHDYACAGRVCPTVRHILMLVIMNRLEITILGYGIFLRGNFVNERGVV